MTQWFLELGLFRRRKERIEIAVETNETWKVEWFRESRSELCPVCGAETIFIPAEIGAQVVRADSAVIEDLLDTGQVHSSDGADGESRICLSSLKRSMEKESLKKFLK